MENKNQEELQSRREFFKSAAKAALPVLAIAVLGSPVLTSCDKKMSQVVAVAVVAETLVPVVAANHVLAGVMEDALVIAMMVAPLIAGMVATVGKSNPVI